VHAKKKMTKKKKLFILTGPASSQSLKIQALVTNSFIIGSSLDASQKKNKKKKKLFTLTGLAVSCSFKPESQNSSSRYREVHNLAQALMQAKK
jgi:hypothetical protein